MDELNQAGRERFVQIVGPMFEHSPWIADRTWVHRPFRDVRHLHEWLCDTVRCATRDEQIGLITAHPDLVGRAALAGGLTVASTGEQAAAGLDRLTTAEIELFQAYNAQYRERFGFPFVICARENKEDAILAAFPVRLGNSREQEIGTALREIFIIARFRLADAVADS